MIPLSQMIWLRSVTDHPSEPKKGGLYGCSVRKSDFWATFGPKKKTKILCWPRCTAGLGAAAAGFSACNCLFDSHNCLLTSLILDPYYKLNWPKRASAVYWLFGTLLYPWTKRPLTGKPKVSGVTSGYEDVMIPLSQICDGSSVWAQKRWVIWV